MLYTTKKRVLLAGGWGLALTLVLLAPVQAQVVINDPTQTMIHNGASPFRALKAMPEAQAQADKGKKDVVQPLPPELQPELDLPLTSASPQPEPVAPIKARAVVVDINSNNLNYDQDHDVYVATGSVHMVISEQNSELFADKLTYDQNQNLAIAEGNVIIVKNGQRTEGSYAKIDLTRKSALINDAATTISAVRVKANQAFVNKNELILENGRMIISGLMYQQMASQGGLRNIGQSTGKGSQQAKLRREYSKKVYQNRDAMRNQLSFEEQQTFDRFDKQDFSQANFDEDPDSVSRFSLKAKEIEIIRHEDGYDDITLKKPSLYMGKFKLFSFPNTDFSYDEQYKNIQYLGPDVGSYRAYGGAYAGPGWDFHVGRGSLRLSPVVSYGSPGFWSPDGKSGKHIANGLGFGGIAHYRDPDTAIDLAYNSHIGSPILFMDRRVFTDSTHFMASYNDMYQNGLLGQMERPTYIAQLTDYRVLKDFSKFQLTSFESIGYARDNFYPNFRDNYFVEATGSTPQTLGRAQLQLQLANTAPLIRVGKFASVGMRAQLLSSAYTSGDFVGLGRIGPTLGLRLFDNRLQSSMSYTLTHSVGKSPFVFDSYYGGAQNVSMNNLVKVNKYLSIGNSGSYSLNRDNAKNALTVGNMVYMMVGPQDFKATVGYDFINSRSHFGLNFYPGNNNTLVHYDKMRIVQPGGYTPGTPTSSF